MSLLQVLYSSYDYTCMVATYELQREYKLVIMISSGWLSKWVPATGMGMGMDRDRDRDMDRELVVGVGCGCDIQVQAEEVQRQQEHLPGRCLGTTRVCFDQCCRPSRYPSRLRRLRILGYY